MTRPESVMTWVVVVIFASAGAVLYIVGVEDPTLRDSGGEAASILSVAGSTTVLPFAEACAREFSREGGDIVVNVTGGGTDAGLALLAAGKIDIAMASRRVGNAEMEALGGQLSEYPVARDGITMVVSREIRDAGVDDLSSDKLSAIYAGDIGNWKELGGPDREIVAVSRSHGSGTGEIFSERVATPGAAVYLDSSSRVEEYVAGSDRAIGYLGLSLARDEDLGIVAYEGVVPSVATVGDGSYPLARTLYMYTWGEPDGNEMAFLDFVTRERGQAIAEDLGFVPISTGPGQKP